MHNNNNNDTDNDMMAGDTADRNFNFNLFELANLSITSSLQHSAAGLSKLIARPSTTDSHQGKSFFVCLYTYR